MHNKKPVNQLFSIIIVRLYRYQNVSNCLVCKFIKNVLFHKKLLLSNISDKKLYVFLYYFNNFHVF